MSSKFKLVITCMLDEVASKTHRFCVHAREEQSSWLWRFEERFGIKLSDDKVSEVQYEIDRLSPDLCMVMELAPVGLPGSTQ